MSRRVSREFRACAADPGVLSRLVVGEDSRGGQLGRVCDRQRCPRAEVQTPAPGPCSASDGTIFVKSAPLGLRFHICATGWQYTVYQFRVQSFLQAMISVTPWTDEGAPWTLLGLCTPAWLTGTHSNNKRGSFLTFSEDLLCLGTC